MANCQKCENQKKIAALIAANGGLDANAPEVEELRRKCLECANGGMWCGLSDPGYGTIHLDAAANPSTVLKFTDPDYTAARRPRMSRTLEKMPEGIEEYLHAMLSAFKSMDIRDVEILHGMLNGMTCTEIAAAMGYRKRATVHARIKKAISHNPWLNDLYLNGYTLGVKSAARSMSWTDWNGKAMMRGDKVLADVPGADPDELA